MAENQPDRLCRPALCCKRLHDSTPWKLHTNNDDYHKVNTVAKVAELETSDGFLTAIQTRFALRELISRFLFVCFLPSPLKHRPLTIIAAFSYDMGQHSNSPSMSYRERKNRENMDQ